MIKFPKNNTKTPNRTAVGGCQPRFAGWAKVCAAAVTLGFSLSAVAMATETALDHLNPIRASVGVTAFQKYCGGTKGKAAKVKRALKSDADFVLHRDQDAKVLALHKHDAIQVSVNSENICSVFFLTTAKPAVATERATALLKHTKLIKGTGKKMMRFRTDYKSSLGTVIVLNHEVLSIKGMEIALMK